MTRERGDGADRVGPDLDLLTGMEGYRLKFWVRRCGQHIASLHADRADCCLVIEFEAEHRSFDGAPDRSG